MLKAIALVAPLLMLATFGATSGLPDRHSMWTGQTFTGKNGAKVTALGTKLTIATADGKSTTIDRADPQFASGRMPVAVTMMSCAKLEQYIKLYPLTDSSWRRAVVAYSNKCL